MQVNKTFGNRVYVKLDPPNDHIERVPGIRIEIDTSYEPEKHLTRTGTVVAVPEKLIYKRGSDYMEWKTEMELQVGDRVVMYYLAVYNCIKNGAYEKDYEYYHGKRSDKYEEFVYMKYQNIYAAIRNGKVIPINGYVLVEPIDDPVLAHKKKEAEGKKIQLVVEGKPNNTHAVYGRIVYIGTPNKEYIESYLSDENIDVKVGDEVIMKRISDIPMEYEYHAKVDGGRKLFRLQRHEILSVL